MKLRDGFICMMLFGCLNWMTTTSALAQSRGEAISLHLTSYSPIVSLIAGVLIFVFPRLLNYIVAIYLIVVGLLGLLGR